MFISIGLNPLCLNGLNSLIHYPTINYSPTVKVIET